MAVHAGRMESKIVQPAGTGKGEESFARQDGNAVPRFAPNFTVYVLEPEVVCLYSEDRKFFLHGALYCALAAALGEGKSFQDIVASLGERFPADKVREGLGRMLDRRFIVTDAEAGASPAAAYWASLGLPPGLAEDNLAKLEVSVAAIDVQGADELTAALRELGVRVTEGAGDLIVTLVSDYLDPALEDLNRQHLEARTPWLLVQPSGIFPLVGPIFRPGTSACWECLAERMRRNREVKALLDRKGARRVSVSPLAQDPLGKSAIHLAAVEIAKAIATGFRTPLNDQIVSLDLLGSSIVKHHVARRPQCPVCGQEELRDPDRAPLPIEIDAGGELVMTSGGYRAFSSSATVARHRKHVSPLTGVVSRLERISVELPLNTNWLARHNFAARPESIGELKAGLSSGSFGKGSTAEQGEASALMEAIERYSGSFQGDEIRVIRRFTDFVEGEAILPNDITLYSAAQFRQMWLEAMGPGQTPPGNPDPFDRSAEIEWSPVWSLRDQRFRYVPTSLLYFFYHGPGDEHPADSNGCAAGNTREEAIVQGFLELVERDAYAIWWYNRLRRPAIDLAQVDDAYVRDLQLLLAESGRKLWVLDVTSDLGIPTFVAVTHWLEDGKEQIEFGSGAHFDARIALLRAMTELSQFLAIGMMGGRKPGELAPGSEFHLEHHPYLIPQDGAPVHHDFSSTFGRMDRREQVMSCVRVAERQGLDFLVLDQTRPDIEVPVVRVIVPGMRHFYRRFGPGRLYDVPVRLGLLERPTPESDLNPLHPKT